MRDGSLLEGFSDVLDLFEALLENLERMKLLYVDSDSKPEDLARIERAIVAAGRATELVRGQIQADAGREQDRFPPSAVD